MNQRVVGPLVEFLREEAAGGIAVLVGTLFALAWANGWGDGYEAFWHRELGPLDLHHWVNDALMAVFFFVVGLEIKRELSSASCATGARPRCPRSRRSAVWSLPTAICLARQRRRRGRRRAGRSRWPPTSRSPSGCSRCSAPRARRRSSCSCWRSRSSTTSAPSSIIAVFYADELSLAWLGAARRAGRLDLRLATGAVWHPAYVVLAIALWIGVYESGVHATIAGVVLGLLTPRPSAAAGIERSSTRCIP